MYGQGCGEGVLKNRVLCSFFEIYIGVPRTQNKLTVMDTEWYLLMQGKILH